MRLLHPWNFPGKSTGVGCHFLLQRIFPTQGSSPGLLHCKQMLLPSEPWGKLISHCLNKKFLSIITVKPVSTHIWLSMNTGAEICITKNEMIITGYAIEHLLWSNTELIAIYVISFNPNSHFPLWERYYHPQFPNEDTVIWRSSEWSSRSYDKVTESGPNPGLSGPKIHTMLPP